MDQDNIIYMYTSDEAIEDGFMADITRVPHSVDIYGKRILATSGIMALQGVGFDKKEDDYLFFKGITEHIKTQYDAEVEEDLNGGNDKHFFSIKFRGQLMFVADNEFGGLTIMLPEEY